MQMPENMSGKEVSTRRGQAKRTKSDLPCLFQTNMLLLFLFAKSTLNTFETKTKLWRQDTRNLQIHDRFAGESWVTKFAENQRWPIILTLLQGQYFCLMWRQVWNSRKKKKQESNVKVILLIEIQSYPLQNDCHCLLILEWSSKTHEEVSASSMS